MDIKKETKQTETVANEHAPLSTLQILKKMLNDAQVIKCLIAIGITLIVIITAIFTMGSMFSDFKDKVNIRNDSSAFHQIITATTLYHARYTDEGPVFADTVTYKDMINKMINSGYLREAPNMMLGDIKLHQLIYSRLIGFSFGNNETGEDTCSKMNRFYRPGEIQSFSNLDVAAESIESLELICFKNEDKKAEHPYFVGYKL